MRILYKYFLSDLHIADKSWPDDFGLEREAMLINLLYRIIKDVKGEKELILLGDILDFSVMDHLEVDELESVNRCIDRVAMSYPQLFSALRAFVKNGNRIFYVPGNHDFAMRIHKTVHRFFHHLLPRFCTRRVTRLLSTGHYYVSPTLKIYAEHGNRYDSENVHTEHGMPFGSIIADRFVRRWERLRVEGNQPGYEYPLRNAKHVRPHTHMIGYINNLVEQGLLPVATKDRMIRQLVSLYAGTDTPVPQRFFKFLENAPARIRESVVSTRLKDSYPRQFAQKAEQLLKGYQTGFGLGRRLSITESLDLSFNPRLVVMGHTHALDERDFGSGYRYVNTGTWCDIVLVNEVGVIQKIVGRFPYVEVTANEAGVPQARFFDAKDNQPLDVAAVKTQIIQAGVKME